MRTISTTLEIAQAANVQRPYVALESKAQYCNRALFRLNELNNGDGDPSGFCAVCMSGDNKLIRAINDGAIKVSHDYGAWVQYATSIIDTPIALAQNGANIWIYFWNSSRTAIQQIVSTNNGVSWSAPTTIYTLPSGTGWSLAAIYSINQRVIFSTSNGDIRLLYFNGSTWQAQTTNAPSGFSKCDGLTLDTQSSTLRIVGAFFWLNTDGSYINKVLSYTLNDGAAPTWNSGYEGLLFEGNSTSISYIFPALMRWNGLLYIIIRWNIAGYGEYLNRVTYHSLGAVISNHWQVSPSSPLNGTHFNTACVGGVTFGYGTYTLDSINQMTVHPVVDCVAHYDIDSDVLDATVFDGSIANEIVLTLGYSGEGVQHIFWRESAFTQPNGSIVVRAYGVMGLLKRETTLADRIFLTNSGVPLTIGNIIKIVLGGLNIDTSIISGIVETSYFSSTPNVVWSAGESVYDLIARLMQYAGYMFRFQNMTLGMRQLSSASHTELAVLDGQAGGFNEKPTGVLVFSNGSVGYFAGLEYGKPERLAITNSQLSFISLELFSRASVATLARVLLLRPNVALEILDDYLGVKITSITTHYSARGEWVQEVGVGSGG